MGKLETIFHEMFFDCGAYDGDSIRSFIDRVGIYDKVFACEPDAGSYERLTENVRANGWENIVTHRIGLSDSKGMLAFCSGGGQGSRIEESGEDAIAVDTIDNLVQGERVSIIKMDIEGTEMLTV